MTTLRRFGAVLLASVVMSAFLVAVPARAAQVTQTLPEAFIASASAQGLEINLLGTRITIGASTAGIDSSVKATARGAGVLEPLIGGTVATAEISGLEQLVAPPEACVLNLPLLGVLTLATACGEAKASSVGGLPVAIASGTVASIELGGSLLTPLLNQVGALVGQTVGAVLNQLTTLLGALVQPLLGALNLNLNSLVDQLFEGLQRATGVLAIRLGTSTSQAVTTASKVTSNAIAQGAVIEVLPGLTLGGAPLLTVTIGDARANVDVTRAAPSNGGPVAAVATPSFEAAIVRIDLGLPLLGNVTSIPVGLGQSITLLDGTPLRSVISAGAGSVKDGPDGAKTAVADGVSLQLLTGLSGGIGIALAHAEATGAARSAVFSVQEKAVVPQPELARTGQSGGAAWFPMLGAALLLAALAARRAAGASRPVRARTTRARPDPVGRGR